MDSRMVDVGLHQRLRARDMEDRSTGQPTNGRRAR